MPKGKYIRTEEVRQKARLRHLGLRASPELKQKLSEIHKKENLSQETRKKISDACKGEKNGFYGKTHTKESLEKNRQKHKGKKHSLEARKRMSEAQRKRVAEGKHHLWKGGITEKHLMIRCSMEYKLWRQAVFKRDNWTCIWCGQKSGKLNADHIKPFSLFPELRLAIDNGRTLCENCHVHSHCGDRNPRRISKFKNRRAHNP